MSEPFEEPDEEEVEDMLVEMREHMFASDLLAVATTEEAQQVLANHFALVRKIADTVANLAMILGRIPTPEMATMIAGQLREMAEGLEANLPVKPRGENDENEG